MRFLFLIALLLSTPTARAVYRTNITINITNAPTGSTQTLAIATPGASTTRIWTNTVSDLATHIRTTNTIPWSRSNLYAHLILSKPARVGIAWENGTNINIIGAAGETIDISASGFWAILVTNFVGSASSTNNTIVADGAQLDTSVRTNDYSLLVTSIDNFSTNGLRTNSATMINFAAKTNSVLYNSAIHDAELTNFSGVGRGLSFSNVVADNFQATNPIVWGSLRLGDTNSGVSSAWALQSRNGNDFGLYNDDLIGRVYSVSNNGGVIRTWINNNPAQDITTNWGIFYSSFVYTPSLNATAFNISTGTKSNSATLGTNQISAAVGYTWSEINSVANGNNVITPLATKSAFNLTGPTATFNINSLTNSWDGREVTLRNNTTFNMVLMNESGFDGVAANRILTGTGADITVTNQPGVVTLIYYATRWNIKSRSH